MGDAQEVAQALTGMDFVLIGCSVLTAMGLCVALKALWDKFVAATGITTKQAEARKRESKTIDEHEEKLKDLEVKYEHIEKTALLMLEDVKETKQVLEMMQDKIDSNQRARLKDRIGECYRIYHSRGCWSAMEKEAFGDLISAYETAGGKNSFVHTICLPESYTWKVV